MRTYIQPAMTCQALVPNTFVCGVTSVNAGEQPNGHPQLAPGKGDFIG